MKELEETLRVTLSSKKKLKKVKLVIIMEKAVLQLLETMIKKFRMKKINIYQKAREKNWRKANVEIGVAEIRLSWLLQRQ